MTKELLKLASVKLARAMFASTEFRSALVNRIAGYIDYDEVAEMILEQLRLEISEEAAGIAIERLLDNLPQL